MKVNKTAFIVAVARFTAWLTEAGKTATSMVTLLALLLTSPVAASGAGGTSIGLVILALLPVDSTNDITRAGDIPVINDKLNQPAACGLIALRHLARALNHTPLNNQSLKDIPIPAEGFSMKQLVEIGSTLELDLQAVQWPENESLIVPSIVHCKQGHYLTVIGNRGTHYEVQDSAANRSEWMEANAIRALSTGNILAAVNSVPLSWHKLDAIESAQVRGAAVIICPPCIADLKDGCANGGTGCSDCYGMTRWGVSEPYINLWLHDEPLGYQPGLGYRISLKLSYKQREDAGSVGSFFNFGHNWNCSFLSYVLDDHTDAQAIMESPGGGQRTYTPDGSTVEYFSFSKMQRNVDLANNLTGFTVFYPNGAIDYYNYIATNNILGLTAVFLSAQVDPYGHTNQFAYSTDILGQLTLLQVDDADGQATIFTYGNLSNPLEVTTVTDPFGRFATMAYDGSGRLTNITDVQGLSSSFIYNADGSVTNLVTPYGTTSFVYTTNTATDNVISRSILVSDPVGAKNLFVYRAISQYLDNSGSNIPLIPASYPTNLFPTNPPTATLNNGNSSPLYYFNSFHWGPRQYANLSTTNMSSFTTNDYNLARLKNWLLDVNGDTGHTVNLQREPSPDGTALGQITWYDYDGKYSGYEYEEGTNFHAALVSRVLPDTTTAYTWYVHDAWGHPTNVVDTFSSGFGANVSYRTNRFVYDSTKDIDLLQIIGPRNELLAGLGYTNHDHHVTSVTNAVGDVGYCFYDTYGRLGGARSFAGLTSTNIYPSSGMYSNFPTTNIVFGIGSTNIFSYANNLIYVHTNSLGLVTTNLYDNLQRLTNSSNPKGVVSLFYQNLDLVKVLDRMGFTNSFAYDQDRRLKYKTNALGNFTYFDYCGCGSLDSIQDAMSNVTHFSYNNAGWRTNILFADGYQIKAQYDALGRLTNAFDSSGAGFTNWYNNQGKAYALSNSIGQLFRLGYDIENRMTNIVNPNGISVNVTYDSLGRIISRTYPDTGAEYFGYAAAGLIRYTNQLGKITTNAFDSARRKIATTNANGEGVQFAYDSYGHLLTLTDGKGHTTTWNYDIYGLLSNKVDAANNSVLTFKYDADNRMTNRNSITKGNTYYSLDPVGNVTNIAYNVSPAISIAYDALNRPTTMTDASGTNRYTYDSVGELLSEDGPWADDTVLYGYANRLRTSLQIQQPDADAWKQTYAYDASGRMTNIVTGAGTFAYQYDATRQLQVGKLIFPNAAYVTNSYDSMARLLSTVLENSANSVLDSHVYTYNFGNQITEQTLDAGNYTDYGYDNIGQLVSALGKEAGGVTNRLQEQMQYAYDAAHNLSVRTNNNLIETFNVDSLNELTTISRNATNALTVAGTTTSQATNVTINASPAFLYNDFTFASSNSFTITNGNNTFTALAKDVLGRSDTNSVTINLPATNSFSYDLNGNLSSDGVRGFDYDDENQLIRITATNAWKSEFTYDGRMRRRVRKEFTWQYSSWIQTNEVRYVYDGNLVVQERDVNNLPLATYTRGKDLGGSIQGAGGIGGLLARRDRSNGQTTYYHSDASGNVVTMLNSSQLTVAAYSYDPFGRIISQRGTLADVNLYCFASKELHSPSGLTYFGFRFYDSSNQRWLNRDPLGEAGGINLYASMLNNALSNLDPLGLVSLNGFFGCLRSLGGLVEIAVGGFIATVVPVVGPIIGGAVMLHGLDVAQAGFTQMTTDKSTDTYTSQWLQSQGVSQSTANTVDSMISLVDTGILPVWLPILFPQPEPPPFTIGPNSDCPTSTPAPAPEIGTASTTGTSETVTSSINSSDTFNISDVLAAIESLEAQGYTSTEVQSSIDPGQVITIAEAMQDGSFQNSLMSDPVIIDASTGAIMAGTHRMIAAQMTGFQLNMNYIDVNVPTFPLSSVPIQSGRVNPTIK